MVYRNLRGPVVRESYSRVGQGGGIYHGTKRQKGHGFQDAAKKFIMFRNVKKRKGGFFIPDRDQQYNWRRWTGNTAASQTMAAAKNRRLRGRSSKKGGGIFATLGEVIIGAANAAKTAIPTIARSALSAAKIAAPAMGKAIAKRAAKEALKTSADMFMAEVAMTAAQRAQARKAFLNARKLALSRRNKRKRMNRGMGRKGVRYKATKSV